MAGPRSQLSKAPLREALIDIQFEPDISIEEIDRYLDQLNYGALERKTIFQTEFAISPGADGETASTESAQSVIGRRVDGLRGEPYVLQVRKAGFTLSRLTPYESWDGLSDCTRDLWSAFCASASFASAKRIAVRYINELRVPLPVQDFGDYLSSPPVIPDSLPQGLSAFLSRVQIPDPSGRFMAIVTQAMDGPPIEDASGSSIVIVLDIDVFQRVQVDRSNIEDVWATLATLREVKNRFFFEYLTDTAVEMYV